MLRIWTATALAYTAFLGSAYAETEYLIPGEFSFECQFTDECNVGLECRQASMELRIDHAEGDNGVATVTYKKPQMSNARPAKMLASFFIPKSEKFYIFLIGDAERNVIGEGTVSITINSQLEAFYTAHIDAFGQRAIISRNGSCRPTPQGT